MAESVRSRKSKTIYLDAEREDLPPRKPRRFWWLG
jgi:hypothetical protein